MSIGEAVNFLVVAIPYFIINIYFVLFKVISIKCNMHISAFFTVLKRLLGRIILIGSKIVHGAGIWNWGIGKSYIWWIRRSIQRIRCVSGHKFGQNWGSMRWPIIRVRNPLLRLTIQNEFLLSQIPNIEKINVHPLFNEFLALVCQFQPFFY